MSGGKAGPFHYQLNLLDKIVKKGGVKAEIKELCMMPLKENKTGNKKTRLLRSGDFTLLFFK